MGLHPELARERVDVLTTEQAHHRVGLATHRPAQLLLRALLLGHHRHLGTTSRPIIQGLIGCPKEPGAVDPHRSPSRATTSSVRSTLRFSPFFGLLRYPAVYSWRTRITFSLRSTVQLDNVGVGQGRVAGREMFQKSS
jgi:hypothetical protein